MGGTPRRSPHTRGRGAATRYAVFLRAVDLGTPVSGLDQQALAGYLAGGALRRHIARARRDYAHRRRHLARQLAGHPALRLRGTFAGLHAVIDLPPSTDVPTLIQVCAARGFLFADLRDYDATPHPAASSGPAVVVGYGAATLSELDRAVATLATS